MKKFISVLSCFLLFSVLAAQETVVQISFARNSDSVIVNDVRYGKNDRIRLSLHPGRVLVCKTDTEGQEDFGLKILLRGEPVASVNRAQYIAADHQLAYTGIDPAKTYTIKLQKEARLAVAEVGFVQATPAQVNPVPGVPAIRQPVSNDTQKSVIPGDLHLPGIAFYDALALSDPGILTKEELRNYFRYYFNAPLYSSEDIIEQIRDTARNKYLYNSIDTAAIFHILREPDSRDFGSQSLAGTVTSFLPSSIGGLDVTSIADGFAKFIVKRAKTELNVAFFDRFGELISRPEYADLRTLFPQTYRALMAIGEEIYNYDAYIQTLRECFEKDLANLLTTMPEVLGNHPEFFRLQPELRAILESSFYLGQALQDRQNPGDILANYPDSIWKSCNPNYMATFRTLKLLSGSLRSNDPESKGYWVTTPELKKLVSDRQAMMIYLGLLIESGRNAGIVFVSQGRNFVLSDILNRSFSTLNSDLPKYERFITTFVNKSGDIASKLNGLKKTGSDSLLLENYYSFFTSVIDLLKFTSRVEELPHVPRLGLKEKTGQYMDAAQTTADIVIDVNRRNYSSAVVNLYHLYTVIFSKDHLEMPLAALQKEQELDRNKFAAGVEKLDALKGELADEKDAGKKEQIRKEISSLNDTLQPWFDLCNEYERLDNMTAVLNAIYKYGSLMATVVAAKTSDEVAEAIEAAALPAGSSRIKKETKFNVCLNAYLGLYVGYEQIRGFDTTGFKLNSFGVSAPIGVALSRGHSVFFIPTGKAGWSTSAFVSFIDIGAVASFRVQDDSTSQIPTIHLQDIISPGVFLSIGFPKFPVSVNFGVQMGPNLRTVTATGNDYSNSLYLRYSASLVVDIPIFNFYSKTRD